MNTDITLTDSEKFYKITVKMEIENGEKKNGEPKIERVTEEYIYKAKSNKEASARVEEMFKDSSFIWRITSTAELSKVVAVIV